MSYNSLPTPEVLAATAEALTANGFQAVVVNTGAEAKAAVLERIPQGAEVMTMTSKTTEGIGLDEVVNTSGNYKPVRELLNDPDADPREKKRYGAAPEWSTGSVHAVTQDGRIMIASRTGSQLPAHVYGADHVIFVVGAQKIVKDLDDGTKRIYEYVLPLESERAHKAYGVPGSDVSNLLIMNKANPFTPGRTTVILVNEVLGF